MHLKFTFHSLYVELVLEQLYYCLFYVLDMGDLVGGVYQDVVYVCNDHTSPAFVTAHC